MAVKSAKLEDQGGGVAKVTWEALAAGDTGSPINIAEYPSVSAQAVGDATDVAIEGSNDGGTTWEPLKDVGGTLISLANTELVQVQEHPLQLRPRAVDGTDTDVFVCAAGNV